MPIKVRYFASLKESVGRAEEELVVTDILTVAEVWAQANQGIDKPSHILAAVNMEYVEFDHLVNDGDEVAFFPPVTGG
jgi:molybdopterin synthase sulfur carrier subunit